MRPFKKEEKSGVLHRLRKGYSFDLSASFLPWRSLCGHQYRPAYLPHIDPPYVLICICIYIYICIYASAPFNVKELFLMPQLAPEQEKYNDKSSLQPEYKTNLNFATGKAL